jgi:hypothetical protein
MRDSACIISLVAATACGARTPLESSASPADGGFVVGPFDSGSDAPVVCTPTAPLSPPPCKSWRAAGDGTTFVAPPARNSGNQISAAIAFGCDVLVGWSTQTFSRPETLAWSTRVLGFDGSPRTEVLSHPALTTMTENSGAMSLATSGASVAGLAADSTGCHFLPLDARGADGGDAVEEGSDDCLGLAAEVDGFSYVTRSKQGGTPADLVRIDARGAVRARTTLPVPSGRVAWDRFVFDDDSFVLYTFREDPATGKYSNWLQHFTGRGAPLAPERDVDANTAPVHVAATATGMLAAWTWSSVNLVPLTRDGTIAGALRPVPVAGPLYGMTLASVPNGDAILFWDEATPTNDFKLFVQAIAPDGVPRAPATLVRTTRSSSGVFVVVAPQGDRALVVFEGGLALPLECAG